MFDETQDVERQLLFDGDVEKGQVARTANGEAVLVAQANVIDDVVKSRGWRAEKHYDLSEDGKCSIDDHRTCEMRVAVGMAADISQTEGAELPPGLARIWDEQAASETQLRQAIVEWSKSVPDERREEAEGIVYIVHNSAEAMKE